MPLESCLGIQFPFSWQPTNDFSSSQMDSTLKKWRSKMADSTSVVALRLTQWSQILKKWTLHSRFNVSFLLLLCFKIIFSSTNIFIRNCFFFTDKPRWFKEHISTEEAYGFIGGTVNMTCSALAEPGAEFTWINDNKTLQPGDDGIEIFNSLHHSTLQV